MEIMETKAPSKLFVCYLLEAAMTVINFHLFICYSQNYKSSYGYLTPMPAVTYVSNKG